MPSGGLVNRNKTLTFEYDGHQYNGFEGDTLASALLACGVRVMGRSFKYHRPRGPWGAWFDDPNAIFNVTLNGREFPNCPATTTMLEHGMSARSVNAYPTAEFDIKGGLDLFHRWLGAGFYYKTFMWPNWHLFEPMIRRMAGLGALNREIIAGYTSEKLDDYCETLIIGGGGAGLAAARAAAENGQQVVLIDDHPEPGGGLYVSSQVEGEDSLTWIGSQMQAITQAGGSVLMNTTAFGVYDHNLVALAQSCGFGWAPRLIRMRANKIILATGAMDRPITFKNNDRPGVMSLHGSCEYLARYGVLVGQKIAVLSNNSFAQPAIDRLKQAGASVSIHDPAKGGLCALGGKKLSAIEVAGEKFNVDTVLTSGGMTPVVHLWCHAGGKLDWDKDKQAFVPGTAPQNMMAIGAANGIFELEQALIRARSVAAGSRPGKISDSYRIKPHWPEPGSHGRQWIDFSNDVTLKDVELAARENYVSVEHLKRYTTLGMATDQGKTSNMTGLAAMAAIQGRPIPEVGTTTFRPPFVPVPLELYHGRNSGQLLHPLKRLPLENRHRAADAALGEYGGWLRPGWYGSDKAQQHINEEVIMARSAAAIFDATPLGKIEVMGPDAEQFVSFIYYNTLSTLKPGAIRYGFMLTEAGIVYDDGVILRMDDNRFVISCSSSHVDGVARLLETWRQDGNDPDRIFIHDTTQNWATITVSGPEARNIVGALDLPLDFSPEHFGHMTFKLSGFQGSPVRISRVSFTGDLSFEISMAPCVAGIVWDALCKAARPLGAGPMGVEALAVLRAEKGYIMIGKDTDGETMPHDLGITLPRMNKKTAFVGDRGLHSDVANSDNRKQLVGLSVPQGASLIPTGAHVVSDTDKPVSIGIITSSYYSPTLDKPIAMGLVENGFNRYGDSVSVWHLGQRLEASVCDPCVFDKRGVRINA